MKVKDLRGSPYNPRRISDRIACEQTGRVAFGTELDPVYCDVIVLRWEQFTGKKAVRP